MIYNSENQVCEIVLGKELFVLIKWQYNKINGKREN